MNELEKYQLYTVKELEPILKKSAQTIKRYIKSGELEAIKVKGCWRVSEAQLKKFLGM